MAVISKDLGPVSAYAVAVANGFTGTEAEWEQYIANASTAAQSAAGSATAAANSASAAAQSATAAAASQVAAAGSETEAANYALVAGNHAMAAAASATAAETAETGAETAQAAAEAAQAAAEAVAESIPEDYTELTEEVGGLKSALKDNIDSIINYNSLLEPYLYKTDTYISGNTTETPLAGYNLYKIPVVKGDIVVVSQPLDNDVFWGTLSYDIAFKLQKTDGTYLLITGAVTTYGYRSVNEKIAVGWIPDDVAYMIVTAKADRANYVTVGINTPLKPLNADAVSRYSTVIEIDSDTAFQMKGYRSGNAFRILSGLYYSAVLKIAQGDKVVFEDMLPGVSSYGVFVSVDTFDTPMNINTLSFIAPSDGIIFVFKHPDYDLTTTLYPANSIEIDYSNIKNPPVIPTPGGDTNYYNGLSGVAFGTSLTYRAQTTGGYLQYLPGLSGITFDNQGLGSSTILPSGSLPQMMPMITGYTGYAGKRVCILEGFVNDFYYNGEHLGTWKDTEQTSVCGCVRYALNYILTQNPNLTVFMVMDHYGKGITAANAVNSAGQTSYEFYQEIEKVALSMGVRVIREYELSEISQLTPQYLLDNIHLNDLGAKQSANAIWGEMKKTYPNEVSA